jgi:hypothetical protein
MATLGMLILHFLTSVCSKGQAFKNDLKNSTPDQLTFCNSLCLCNGGERPPRLRLPQVFLCLHFAGAESDFQSKKCATLGGW